MAISWRKNFTQIDNVNNGNEFELNDYPLLDGFNVPLNNTQWLYDEIQKNEKVITGTLSSSNVLNISSYNNLASANRGKLKNWKILITKSESGVQDYLSVFNFVEMQLTNDGEYDSMIYIFQNEFTEKITINYSQSDDSYSSSYEYNINYKLEDIAETDSHFRINKLGLYAVTVRHKDYAHNHFTYMLSIVDFTNNVYSPDANVYFTHMNGYGNIYASSSGTGGLVNCKLIVAY